MIAGWHLSGDIIMIEQMPIMGGYVGSVEETAICDVASTLASFVAFNGDVHLDGPIHVRWGNTTNRQSLQVAAHTAAALDANTEVLISNQYYTLAGPCTEMCLLETAAQAITDTASGRELISGVASAKGVQCDYISGLEARMMGEASSAVCGMNVEQVNSIVDKLLKKYESSFANAPIGKRFDQCYDIDSMVPTREYLEVYDKALKTISDCGLYF